MQDYGIGGLYGNRLKNTTNPLKNILKQGGADLAVKKMCVGVDILTPTIVYYIHCVG
jgi:hypothetical protein